jgi:hypothetical protein
MANKRPTIKVNRFDIAITFKLENWAVVILFILG